MAKLNVATMVTEKVIKMTVTHKFIRPLLGTVANPDVFGAYQLEKARKAGVPEEQLQKELDDLKKQVESMSPAERDEFMKSGTVFPRIAATGELCLMDHQVQGFLKNAADKRRSTAEEETPEEGAPKRKGTKWGNIRGKISDYVKVENATIPFYRLVDGKKVAVTKADGFEERPLRANTAQGPRVSLVRSERLGSETDPVYVEFDISILAGAPITVDMVAEVMKYGERVGYLQWRNAGFGRCETTLDIPDDVDCKYLDK